MPRRTLTQGATATSQSPVDHELKRLTFWFVDLPPLIYLTVDEVSAGVGASQVVPYVERLARQGVDVTLHSFEHGQPSEQLAGRLAAASVAWRPHSFRAGGAPAAAARVAQAVPWLAGAPLVHARSDIAAAAALAARCRHWVWDIRSFWVDQRITMGMVRSGSLEERALRRIESAAAARSSAITTLTSAAIDELAGRHGELVRDKATVITTCADLGRFALTPPPPPEPVQLLLSGTFSPIYDLDLTLKVVDAVRRLRPTHLRLVRPGPSPWDQSVQALGGSVGSAAFEDMPAHVAASHAGLCICRTDDRPAIAGAAPTKLGEFLASGRPVVVNQGLGDMDDLLNRYHCGVVVRDSSPRSLDDASTALLRLLDDPDTAARCRSLATAEFDLDGGVERLLWTYERAVSGRAG